MKEILIAYRIQDGIYCLDRPFNKVSYSMVRISGKQKSINELNNLIGQNEVFDESVLNRLNLYYKII